LKVPRVCCQQQGLWARALQAGLSAALLFCGLAGTSANAKRRVSLCIVALLLYFARAADSQQATLQYMRAQIDVG